MKSTHDTVIPGRIEQRMSAALNIWPSPEERASHPENHAVTIGDLHGNALKFLHLLLKEGLVDIPKEDYEEIASIYKASQGQYDLDAYIDCLSRITLTDPRLMLRSIGDDVADRGFNDHLTFRLFDKLFDLGMNYEVIASNHGVEFLKQFAYGIDAAESQLKTLYVGKYRSFGNSFHGLRNDIKNGVVDVVTIESMLSKSYLPSLKMLSYHILSDNNITIYSHAPINPDKMRDLASLFGVDYQADTVYALRDTIDRINQSFQEVLATKGNLESFFDAFAPGTPEFKILDDFINDRYEHLKPDLTSQQANYNVLNVHGHVGEKYLSKSPVIGWEYINLDSDLGKSPQHGVHHYPVFISNESEKPVLKIDSAFDSAITTTVTTPSHPLSSTAAMFIAAVGSAEKPPAPTQQEKITTTHHQDERKASVENENNEAQNAQDAKPSSPKIGIKTR